MAFPIALPWCTLPTTPSAQSQQTQTVKGGRGRQKQPVKDSCCSPTAKAEQLSSETFLWIYTGVNQRRSHCNNIKLFTVLIGKKVKNTKWSIFFILPIFLKLYQTQIQLLNVGQNQNQVSSSPIHLCFVLSATKRGKFIKSKFMELESIKPDLHILVIVQC